MNTRKNFLNGRSLTLRTPHGDLLTPLFMPIATRGAVKTLSSFDVEQLGSPILLSNAYHLFLRPGVDVLRSFGGLHRFMSWNGAILTDSGGYQVFSLAKTRTITEQGVEFHSHIDGSRCLLTPELSIEVQQIIGSDILMAFDECTPAGVDNEYIIDSIERTTRWAERSKIAYENGRSSSNNQGSQLFGIVQGGISDSLRTKSAHDLLSIGFDGYAIGGLSVGETFENTCRIVELLDTLLPEDRPRYFMGGAKPHEIVAYVQRGIDMFDCVLPTRNARHGLLYRFVHDDLSRPDFYETIHVTNEKYRMSEKPLVASNPELSRFSLGYIRHLFSVEEVLAHRLVTLANVGFYLELMERIRSAIRAGLMKEE